MTSYQTGPFDAPRPIPAAPERTSISGPPSHRGSFSRPSPEQQQQAAEEGYFGPNGAVSSGPAPPNRYAPQAQQYPTNAQKEYEAQRYQSEPTSPMSIPQGQQPYNAAQQQQVYSTSPLRQSSTYGTSPAYHQQQTQQYGTSPQGRRASQPYMAAAAASNYDRRPSLPAVQPPPLQAPADQLHPGEAYYSPQQGSPASANGRRASQASMGSPRHSYSSGDNNYEGGYERRRMSEGGRRRSEATQPRPQLAFEDRRASPSRPSGYYDDDDDDDRRRRRRSRDDDYDGRERRNSKGSSNGSSSGRSKKEIEKMKKEAYGRPSYVDSLSWAGRSVKKFLSSERE